ncbi:MAG: hypothetical protein E7445_03530 [Ruminococcaceae bacterium]|nr:hypothetical protein [Oscillospiraceae bacterium]
MDRQKFLRRGWICGLISPIACLVFILLQMAGFWESGSPVVAVLAGILMVEMVVGTVAPFWWLLTLYRKGTSVSGQPVLLMGLNVFAIIVSVVFFF